MTVSERRAAWCACLRSYQPMLRQQRVLQRGVTPAALVAVIHTIPSYRGCTVCNALAHAPRCTLSNVCSADCPLARRRAGICAVLDTRRQPWERVTAPQASSTGDDSCLRSKQMIHGDCALRKARVAASVVKPSGTLEPLVAALAAPRSSPPSGHTTTMQPAPMQTASRTHATSMFSRSEWTHARRECGSAASNSATAWTAQPLRCLLLCAAMSMAH